MNGSARRIPFLGRKDRDEDLLLFKELQKREKDRIASFIQPVSDEFEHSIVNLGTNPALYRISSGKKESGYDSYGENGKNEYDWLKTPPATPLFPSLEMEQNAPELAVQREIPILQPLSRFAGNSEVVKESNGKPKSPTSKSKIPARSVTPSQRQTILSVQTKNIKAPPILNPKTTHFTVDTTKQTNVITNTSDQSKEKEIRTGFLASNLSKNVIPESKTRVRSSRGVSPLVRSKLPAQIPGFSNETPPNLRTDRSTSATPGRPAGTNLTTPVHQKSEPKGPRRQSSSPSVARGRKESEANSETPKRKIQTGNGGQVFGSKMVEKVMNARKQCAEERQGKPKPEAIITATTSTSNGRNIRGYGLARKSSLDFAQKYAEMKHDRIGSRPGGFERGRSCSRE